MGQLGDSYEASRLKVRREDGLIVKLRKLAKRIPGARALNRIRIRARNWLRTWLRDRLIDISVWDYQLPRSLTQRHLLSIPTVHTVGDALIHFHYTKLLGEEQGRPVFCLTPDAFPSNAYVKFMFEKEEYAIYSEPIYDRILTKLPEKFWIDYWLLERLKRKFKRYNPLVFYRAGYSKERDPIYLQIRDKDSKFTQAYLGIRANDNKYEAFQDYQRLLIEKWDGNPTKFPGYSEVHRAELCERLGLKGKYVCLHIRLYPPQGLYAYDAEKDTDPRGVQKLENYIPVVELLTARGYQVVRMGTHDERRLPDICGYVDYANSGYQNILNDLYLVSGCVFFIGSKSGVECLAALFRKPVLGLNYVCLNSMLGVPELRFCPKTVINRSGRALSTSELLDHEVYYSQGAEAYNRSGLRTVDLTADELVEATEEMLQLVEDPATDWTQYTALQKEFRRMVRPEHLDLYKALGAPCDCYLRKAMLRTERRPE